MRNLYALLLTAMSMEEAKAILGFPPTDSPSRDEINKAWRQKAFENHPDRGGSNEKMVEINVAKDLLEGKGRPTYERSRPEPSHVSPTPYGYRPPEKKPDNVTTFDEAKSSAGIPGGVEWLFVTETQRGRGNYSGDESSASHTAFVAYGQTDSKHVFVGAGHNYYEAFYVGGGPKTDVWRIHSFEYPRRSGEKLEPAWLYGNVLKALKWAGFEGRFNSKVKDARGLHFEEGMPHRAKTSVSIKHILVALGLVSGDDPSVATRKQVVEIQYDSTYVQEGDPPKPGYYKEPDYSSHVMISIIINGRPYVLDERDSAKFLTARIGGKRMPNAIYGDYPRGTKNLTRMRAGKVILTWLAENTSFPQEARDALLAAAAQMK